MPETSLETVAIPTDFGQAETAVTGYRHRVARLIRSAYFTNAAWATIGAGAGQGLQFLGSVIAARLLGPRHFGELGIIQTMLNTLLTAATLGLGVTATTHVARWRGRENRRVAGVIAFSTLVATASGGLSGAGVFLAADKIAAGWLGAPHLAQDIRVAAVLLFFVVVNGSQTGIIAGFEAFKSLAAGNSLRGVAACIGIALGAYFGGVRGALLGSLAAAVLGYVIFNRIIRAQCKAAGIRPTIGSALPEAAALLGFALPVLLSGLTMAPAIWIANSFLATKTDYRQLGLFQVAMHWQIIILFISGCVSGVALPRLAQVAAADKQQFSRLVRLNYLLMVGSAGACAMFVIAGAKLICRLYGSQYDGATSVLIVLAISSVIASANYVPGNVVWAIGAVRVGAVLNLVPATVLVLSSWYLSPIGAQGLAAAYLISGLVHTCVTVPYVWIVCRRRSRSEAGAHGVLSLQNAEAGTP